MSLTSTIQFSLEDINADNILVTSTQSAILIGLCCHILLVTYAYLSPYSSPQMCVAGHWSAGTSNKGKASQSSIKSGHIVC